MNKIINGSRYDTEKAKEVGRWNNGEYGGFDYASETLYQTKSGKFFLHGEGGPRSHYGEWHGNTGSASEKIMPFSIEEARVWAEKNLKADAVEAIFGVIEEGYVNIGATVSPKAKEKLEDAKAKTGENISRIIERLIMSNL